MKRVVVLLGLFAVLIAGCGLDKGYVYDKVDYPAHVSWTPVPHTTCTSVETVEKVGTSTEVVTEEECHTVYVLQLVYHPEVLELLISDCTPAQLQETQRLQNNGQGSLVPNCQTDVWYVDREQFDNTHVGKFVNQGGN